MDSHEINYLLWKWDLMQDICKLILEYLNDLKFLLGEFPVIFDKDAKLTNTYKREILSSMNKVFNWEHKILNRYDNIIKSLNPKPIKNLNDIEIWFKDIYFFRYGKHELKYTYCIDIVISVKKNDGRCHQEQLMQYRSLKPNQKGRWENNYK